MNVLRRFATALTVTLSGIVWIDAPGASPVVPSFSAGDFVGGQAINNLYFPLAPGTRFSYGAQVTDPDSGDTGFEKSEDFVTFQTRLIAGVTARIVHARTWLDGVLTEDTLDYYAQDKKGNVWYLGEDTRAFEYDDNGKLIETSTEGSFLAGVNGAKPGFIMPAFPPQVGFSYYQEFAKNDGALDQAQILSLTEDLTVPVGTFHNVLKTLELNELEPGVLEQKFYGQGVGNLLILEDINASGQALNRIPLQSVAVVPLPSGAWAGLATVAMLLLPRALRATLRMHQA